MWLSYFFFDRKDETRYYDDDVLCDQRKLIPAMWSSLRRKASTVQMFYFYFCLLALPAMM